jgi:hypothetical protein
VAQIPPAIVNPAGQLETQLVEKQAWPALQGVLQPPHWAKLPSLAQRSPHSSASGPHIGWQLPPMQASVGWQTLPQRPQFEGLVGRKTQAPLQLVV